MSQPTVSQVHVSSALTNISVATFQDAKNFAFKEVFPIVPVNKQFDKYFILDTGDLYRDTARPRVGGTESAGDGFLPSTDTYQAAVYALHKDIPDDVLANADTSLDLERAAIQFTQQKLLIQAERKFATTFLTTGVWGTDVSGTAATYWSNKATSDPYAAIQTGCSTIAKNTGFQPNTLVVGFEVDAALRQHPLVLDRYKYTSADSITADMIARTFNLKRYIVSAAVYTTSAEGQTDTFDFAVGKNALLCYVPENPSILTPAAGYTFVWSGYTGLGNTFGMGVRSFYMQWLRSTRYECEFAYDMKKIGAAYGYFFSGIVA